MKSVPSARDLGPAVLGALLLPKRDRSHSLGGEEWCPQHHLPPLSQNLSWGSLHLQGLRGICLSLCSFPACLGVPWRSWAGLPPVSRPILGICCIHHSARVEVDRLGPLCFTSHLSVGFFFWVKQSQ